MRNLMVVERVTVGGVVELAQRMNGSQLVQIGWIAAALVAPELVHVNELLSGGLQVMFLVAGRCVKR